jgi:hypothetical protein
MHNISVNFLLNDSVTEDEIDELFAQLEQYEPPTDMVERVMAAAAQLPRPKPLSQWNGFELLLPDYDETQFC